MEQAADVLGSPAAAATVMGLRRSRAAIWRWVGTGVAALIGIGILVAAFQGGLSLRGWLWNHTDTIRFRGDIQNAVYWGNRVVEDAAKLPAEGPADSWRGRYGALWKAYVGFYDQVAVQRQKRAMHLDYAPLRLAVAALWARHIRELPGGKRHPWDDEAIAFMLRINTAMELMAAAAMFGLVFYWVRREEKAGGIETLEDSGGPWSILRGMRAWILAGVAGLLLWFNPAVLVNAHVWPQWDIVAVAFFLAAALALSVNACLVAGVLVAIGGMWKGQILMVAPILVLWPLFAGQWRRALRGLAGFAAGAGLLASPWLVAGRGTWILVGVLALGAAVGSWWLFRQWRHRAAFVAGVLGAAIFGAGAWMGGSWAWFQTGFVFGANQWQAMNMGATINLPALMHARWRWKLNEAMVTPETMSVLGGIVKWGVIALALAGTAGVAWPMARAWRNWRESGRRVPVRLLVRGGVGLAVLGGGFWFAFWAGGGVARGTPLTVKWGLQIIYGITLVLCAVGAARHSRRNSVGVLIALAAPWVLMFALVAQLHERYLMWGAAMTAAFVAVSFGLTLLHLLTTALAMLPMMLSLLPMDPKLAPKWVFFMRGANPDIGWMVLLLAAIFLYLSLVNRPKRGRIEIKGGGAGDAPGQSST